MSRPTRKQLAGHRDLYPEARRPAQPHRPADLAGWTALDIGCNAGFYSFELARRGATVTGIDVEPLFLAQARWAAREYGLEARVRFEQRQVYDLAHEAAAYDLVLFMGVFYHLRYPMLGLDIVASVVRRLMVFQTLTAPGDELFEGDGETHDVLDRDAFVHPGWPRLSFIERTYLGDVTNWWAPNHAACEAMLRSAGLCVTARPARETYLCAPDPAADAWPRGRGRAELLSATGRPWRPAGEASGGAGGAPGAGGA